MIYTTIRSNKYYDHDEVIKTIEDDFDVELHRFLPHNFEGMNEKDIVIVGSMNIYTAHLIKQTGAQIAIISFGKNIINCERDKIMENYRLQLVGISDPVEVKSLDQYV